MDDSITPSPIWVCSSFLCYHVCRFFGSCIVAQRRGRSCCVHPHMQWAVWTCLSSHSKASASTAHTTTTTTTTATTTAKPLTHLHVPSLMHMPQGIVHKHSSTFSGGIVFITDTSVATLLPAGTHEIHAFVAPFVFLFLFVAFYN